MSQLHKRFTDVQVTFLFQAYTKGLMTRIEVQETLRIGKTRFFTLLKDYRQDPQDFSIRYQRTSSRRISPEDENAIERELLREKALLDDPELPISSYNYSALRDRLKKQDITISLNTIIDRAKKLGCHQPRKNRKTHDREVLTASIGALIQHDGSTHRWSPLTKQKWTLITSIDDYSRPGQPALAVQGIFDKILFADFFSGETTWAHIQATKAVIDNFGLPLRYYVDSLRVFRFVQGRDSFPGLPKGPGQLLAQACAPDRRHRHSVG